jgi:hypothetical protein
MGMTPSARSGLAVQNPNKKRGQSKRDYLASAG